MTFEDWYNSTSEHYFDFLTFYPDIQSIPEWSDLEERMDEVLQDMAYEDAIGCTFEDLIDYAGIRGKIEMARKQCIENKRIERMEGDFV